jgi:diaminohydroxyphosphoribosylaminopyrimidine deaminase / 5-amino-6-(5-phosphoribosylamino)uracil reductase
MKIALAEACRGRGHTSPNPMVGAVVVRDGVVVAKGYHAKAGQPHAEVNAIEATGGKAAGATLYVTLEPCNHQGRTPPCTRKILEAGIGQVVVAAEDPNPDVKGGGIAYLRSRGIEVIQGVCETEAVRLNESFNKFICTKLPFVTLKCAATLDGRIATRTGDSKWVTGAAARAYVHQLRHAMDGILVGIGTVGKDDPRLTTRLETGEGRDPVRVILDTHLRISEQAKVLRSDSGSGTIMAVGEGARNEKPDKFRKIEDAGVQCVELPVGDDGVDLKALVRYLGGIGVTSLLIEGGSRVIASALKSEVVDKVCFFYAPKILGGDDGIPICAGTGPELMEESIRLKDIRIERFDDDVMIEGYIDS